MNDLRRGAFPIAERAAVFLRAVFFGKDPMLEVALEGLGREGLGTDAELGYARTVLGKGEINGFFRSAKSNPGMCIEANTMAVEAVERRGERIIKFDLARPVFVYDE